MKLGSKFPASCVGEGVIDALQSMGVTIGLRKRRNLLERASAIALEGKNGRNVQEAQLALVREVSLEHGCQVERCRITSGEDALRLIGDQRKVLVAVARGNVERMGKAHLTHLRGRSVDCPGMVETSDASHYATVGQLTDRMQRVADYVGYNAFVITRGESGSRSLIQSQTRARQTVPPRALSSQRPIRTTRWTSLPDRGVVQQRRGSRGTLATGTGFRSTPVVFYPHLPSPDEV